MTQIEVRRSARRTRTVSARREGDRTIVMVPAALSAVEERRVVADLLAKLDAREQRQTHGRSDEGLARRAQALAERYVPEAPAPASVRWVTNQSTRWGSCTPTDRAIRISHRVRQMPDHVIDAVLVHELAHLVESGHGPRFQAIVSRYPQLTEAMGFLDGVTWQRRQAP